MTLTNGTSSGEFHGMMKVEGGKLLRVKMSLEEGKISQISFTGDFFLHPEESIEELEENLVGTPIEQDALRPMLDTFFKKNEIVGAGPENFLDLMINACSSQDNTSH